MLIFCSLFSVINILAYLFIDPETTLPPYFLKYQGISEPPPAKLILTGALASTTFIFSFENIDITSLYLSGVPTSIKSSLIVYPYNKFFFANTGNISFSKDKRFLGSM